MSQWTSAVKTQWTVSHLAKEAGGTGHTQTGSEPRSIQKGRWENLQQVYRAAQQTEDTMWIKEEPLSQTQTLGRLSR